MSRGDEFQERDIIRLLLEYGDQMLPEEGISLAEYVLADIEDSLPNFDNPIYGKIAQESHRILLAGQAFSTNYFLQHEQFEIRELSINLLSSPWEYSTNWDEKGYPLQNQPMPERNFNADMRQALDRFKLRKLVKMCELNMGRIRSAAETGDEESLMRYMKIQQKLTDARNEVAKRTGTVVLPK